MLLSGMMLLSVHLLVGWEIYEASRWPPTGVLSLSHIWCWTVLGYCSSYSFETNYTFADMIQPQDLWPPIWLAVSVSHATSIESHHTVDRRTRGCHLLPIYSVQSLCALAHKLHISAAYLPDFIMYNPLFLEISLYPCALVACSFPNMLAKLNFITHNLMFLNCVQWPLKIIPCRSPHPCSSSCVNLFWTKLKGWHLIQHHQMGSFCSERLAR